VYCNQEDGFASTDVISITAL